MVIRQTFERIRTGCAAYDAARGHNRTRDMIDSWGDQLLSSTIERVMLAAM